MFFAPPEIILGSDLRKEFRGLTHKFRRIRRRDPQTAANARKEIEERLLDAAKATRLSFGHSKAESNGMPTEGSAYGRTTGEIFRLSIELVAPLLRQDLTTGERASGTEHWNIPQSN